MREPLPRPFLGWLAAAAVSRSGDAALYFALGWAAGAYGGTAAGFVVTAVVLPRALLLLLGGAVGDRIGPRAVMIAGDAALMVSATALFLLVLALGSPLWLLVTAAAIEGTVTAFYLPAAGSMPRRLVDDAVLGRALGLRQASSQLADLVGGPLGGALVGLAGLAAAAGVDAVSFAAVLVVLIVVRPRRAQAPPTERRAVAREAADGVRVAFTDPALRTALLLTGCLAGLVIPVGTLLLPLLVRERAWDPVYGGLTLGAQSLGAVLVGLVLARHGVAPRPGIAALIGITVAVAALGMLSSVTVAWLAVPAGAALGAGIVLFTGHTGPMILGGSPGTHLSRVQAVLAVVQSTTLVVTTPLLGLAAAGMTAHATVALCGGLLTLGLVLGVASPAFRRARRLD